MQASSRASHTDTRASALPVAKYLKKITPIIVNLIWATVDPKRTRTVVLLYISSKLAGIDIKKSLKNGGSFDRLAHVQKQTLYHYLSTV